MERRKMDLSFCSMRKALVNWCSAGRGQEVIQHRLFVRLWDLRRVG